MSGFPRAIGRVFGRGSRNPEPERVVRRGQMGMNVHLLDVRTRAALRAVHATKVRTSFYGTEHKGPGQYLASALNDGIEVLGVVRYASDDRASWVNLVVRLAQLWPQITHWQIGNEVDVRGAQSDSIAGAFDASIRPTAMATAMEQRGARYAELLIELYPALLAANPRAKLVTSGLAGHPEDVASFVMGMHRVGAAYDILALHAYGPPAWPVAQRKAQLARAAGCTTPLWLTEFGFEPRQKPEVDFPTYQLQEWAQVATRNANDETFAELYGYCLHGDAHAIYTEDWQPLPTAVWLQGLK